MIPAMVRASSRPTRCGAVGPWPPLGLRHNPFGEPPLEELPALVVEDVGGLADWLAGGRRAVQLIGDCGRGKTARLHALGRRFPAAPYVYLAEGESPPSMPAAEMLLIDEAQRLPRRRRRGLFRRLERIALATHEDLARELEKGGLAVRTIRVGGVDSGRLAEIVERRIEWARLPGAEPPRVSAAGIESLLACFGDDVRATLDHLYEAYQQLARGAEPLAAGEPRRPTIHRDDSEGAPGHGQV